MPILIEMALRGVAVTVLLDLSEADWTDLTHLSEMAARVTPRRRSRPDAVAHARHYVAALSPLETRAEDLEAGLTLFEGYPSLGAFDAVLAAVALNRRVEALVSADRAFGEVPHLTWVDPATPNLERLIGR